jgi:hypothetical protein
MVAEDQKISLSPSGLGNFLEGSISTELSRDYHGCGSPIWKTSESSLQCETFFAISPIRISRDSDSVENEIRSQFFT